MNVDEPTRSGKPAVSRNSVPAGGAQPPAWLSARDAGSAQIEYLLGLGAQGPIQPDF
jgi:hypothetical protein